VSLANDLGSNLAGRMTRLADLAATLAPPLGTALNNLDSIFTQLESSSGLNKLASLLIPPNASTPTAAEISDRITACLPFELKLVPAFFGPDRTQRNALNLWRQLTQFPTARVVRDFGNLPPTATAVVPC
jgi:hypothetical protein